jgi:hypothetical protein
LKQKQLIEKYTREAKNLNHNIKFELDKNKNPVWNGETNYKMVEYMRGQLSIIREVVHLLRDGFEYSSDITQKFGIDYSLGDSIDLTDNQ